MTVEKYQRIYEISVTTPDTIEQVAFMICEVFGKNEIEVNELSADKFIKLSNKLQKQIDTKQPWYNWIDLQTDATKITFGQFIETSVWLKNSPIEVLHLVGASLLKKWQGSHMDAADYLLQSPVFCIFDQVNDYVSSLNKLIKSYRGLFGEPSGNEEEDKPHVFIEQYGWLYSAKQVADYEGIPLDKVYDLPVIQALNDLSYLKAKQNFDKWLSKQ